MSVIAAAGAAALAGLFALGPVRPALAPTRTAVAMGAAAQETGSADRRTDAPLGSSAPSAPALHRCDPGDRAGTIRPLMVVVGASFTSGVGAPTPAQGWAHDLARELRWRAVVRGVPGAGYVRRGLGGGGPVGRELFSLRLARLRPRLVIVQAGHNDAGVAPALLSAAVAGLLHRLYHLDPRTRIALVTTFVRGSHPSRRMAQADQTIVATARSVDPTAVIMNPLGSHWRYATRAGGLHPTSAGYLWIARRVAAALEAAGIRPYVPGCGPEGAPGYSLRASA